MQTYSFGDVRLDRRADIITEQIVATGSLVPRRFGGGRKGELAAGRFLNSPKVTPEAILETHINRTAAAAQGRRRIVAIQDTTEVNFSGRDRSRKGLGPGADGKAKGFFIHATVAVDPDSEQIVGVLDAQIWTRPPAGRRKRRQACTVEEKETMRWITAMKCAHLRLLRVATKRIHITDREGDFYPLLARVPDGDDLVIRARHNRKMPAGGRLFDEADAWPDLGVSEIVVPPRGPGGKPRKARVALRAARVRLGKPESRIATPDPDEIEIGLVEVREIDPPTGAKAVHWRLLTTLPTATREEAAEVVRLYRLRWRIGGSPRSDRAGLRPNRGATCVSLLAIGCCWPRRVRVSLWLGPVVVGVLASFLWGSSLSPTGFGFLAYALTTGRDRRTGDRAGVVVLRRCVEGVRLGHWLLAVRCGNGTASCRQSAGDGALDTAAT